MHKSFHIWHCLKPIFYLKTKCFSLIMCIDAEMIYKWTSFSRKNFPFSFEIDFHRYQSALFLWSHMLKCILMQVNNQETIYLNALCINDRDMFFPFPEHIRTRFHYVICCHKYPAFSSSSLVSERIEDDDRHQRHIFIPPNVLHIFFSFNFSFTCIMLKRKCFRLFTSIIVKTIHLL